MLLTDRVAIVTGGAEGIGKGIALKFAEKGCSTVVIFDLQQQKAEETIREISDKGGKGVFMSCDVSAGRQVQKTVDEAIERFGRLDILVNNAGIGPLPKSIIDVPEEEWDRVLAVNLKGMFLCSKAVAPHMKKRRYGRIINISSIAAIFPFGPVVHYSASKGGVLSFTVNLALELAPFHICVNAILPGMIRTEGHDRFIPPEINKGDFYMAQGKFIPAQRVGTPEDVAKAVLFFASDLSDYVTGDRLIVAGGFPYRFEDYGVQ
jgi:3-oxoacyl-[acyl-carrier protein] reductase